jgi:hypothetical protein
MGEAGAEPEPEPAPDPLASLTAEQRQAVEERLAYEAYQTRAALGQVGMDLVNGRPAMVDPQRLGGWAGMPQYQPAAPAQPQYQPAAPEPVGEPEEPADAPIPDPNYSPAEYRAWLQRQTARTVTSAMKEALAPLMEQFGTMRQTTLEMRVEEAVQRVDQAVDQYAPWLGEMLGHPDFEGYYRQALSQIDPSRWRNPQDLAAVAGTVAAYLRPVPAEQWQPPSQARYARARPEAPAPPQGAPAQETWQDRYRQTYGQPPEASAPARNPRTGQFIGRGANAAISRAAAEATSPSPAARLAPAQAQYDDFILQAAQRVGISPEEAKAIMQDNDGSASEGFRRKRLEGLR